MWFTIESDLRFLSHRDTVRAVERAAARAKLPLRQTQGFNPHPVLSLPCPRPVGAASGAELAVMEVTEPAGADELPRRLNEQAPRGMTFTRARRLEAKVSPQPARVDYEAPVAGEALAERVERFNRAQTWPVERSASKRGRPGRTRRIDLKALVCDLRVRAGRLRFSLVGDGQVWARPGEVLDAIGLDPRVDLARLVRTDVRFDL